MSKKELTVIERVAVALGSSDCEKSLISLAAESKEITVITNADGRAQCHAIAMKATKARTGISATGKAARDDANAFSKAVIAEEKRLIEIIQPEEERLKKLRDEWDAKIEAEKAEKARIEQERQDRIQLLIDDMRDYPSQCINFSSLELMDAGFLLAGRDVSDRDFADRADEAAYIRVKSIQKIEEMRAAKLAQEVAAEKAEADRIESERLTKEAADKLAEETARKRAELEAEASRQREQAEALAEQQRIINEQMAAIKAYQDAIAAKEAEMIAAATRIENERLAAEAERAERDAYDARVAEEERSAREIYDARIADENDACAHESVDVVGDGAPVTVDVESEDGLDDIVGDRPYIIKMVALEFDISNLEAEQLLIKLFSEE